MKYLLVILISIFLYACYNNQHKAETKLALEEAILDSIKIRSGTAIVLFHNQSSKMSIISRIISGRHGIDSLFNYIGKIETDTTCLGGGVFNSFGKVNLYADTSGIQTLASLHFILNGKCEGIYLSTYNYLQRYQLNAEGKIFFSNLSKIIEGRIK